MPPTNVQLPKGEPMLADTTDTDEAHHASDVEVGPVHWVLRIGSGVLPNSTDSRF